MSHTFPTDPPSRTAAGQHWRTVATLKGIPDATVARLPVYLRALNQLAEQQIDTISSGALAEAAGVNSAQLRKDLSYLGSYGTRGVGYDVQYLRLQIGRVVGSAHDWPVIIVGLGNLGTALANYSGFYSHGFRVVGLIDTSPDLVGKRIHGLAISDLTELEEVVAAYGRGDRGYRDSGRGRPGGRRQTCVSGRHQHPQLCADGARGARRGQRP